jgi:hypothetical protein
LNSNSVNRKRPVARERECLAQKLDLRLCGRFPMTRLPSNHLLAVDLEAATAGYPAGTGSAVIFRNMPVNSRHVR